MISIRNLEYEIQTQKNRLKKINQKIEQAERFNDEEEYNYWSKEGADCENTIEIYKYLKKKYCE